MFGLWANLGNYIANLLLGGPKPPEKKKPLPEILFLPVIFANGRDDDTEGLKAFFENRPVMFRGEILTPGPHTIFGVDVAVSCLVIEMTIDGRVMERHGIPCPVPDRHKLVVDVSHGVARRLGHARILVGLQVQP
jgi:hypothetical protein